MEAKDLEVKIKELEDKVKRLETQQTIYPMPYFYPVQQHYYIPYYPTPQIWCGQATSNTLTG